MDNSKPGRAPSSDRLRIIVLGYIVRGPVGGMTWSVLHYLAGLRALGHDVWFVEDSGPSAWCCYDPSRGTSDSDPTYGMSYAADALASIGMGDRWAYYDARQSAWLGPAAGHIAETCGAADLLLNIYGADRLHPSLQAIPVRVLVDMDPVFTQIRHLTDPDAHEIAAQHTAFFTFAGNFGNAVAEIPDDGFDWQTTRHPIYLDAWPAMPGVAGGNLTTVMLWDSYPEVNYGNRSFGMKSASFRPYLDLPGRTSQALELTVGSPTAPHQLLRDHGWRLNDPLAITHDPESYRLYIRSSKAEFTVAKHGYVISRCGWFSERSAAYLATGRPVITQETGFSAWLPSGRGVIAFTNQEEAMAGIEEVNLDYRGQCRAAREIAEAYFDSRNVLGQLIEQAITRPRPCADDSIAESIRAADLNYTTECPTRRSHG